MLKSDHHCFRESPLPFPATDDTSRVVSVPSSGSTMPSAGRLVHRDPSMRRPIKRTPSRPLHGIPRPYHLHLHHSRIHACRTTLPLSPPPASYFPPRQHHHNHVSLSALDSSLVSSFSSSRLIFSLLFSPPPSLSCSLGTCGGSPAVKPLSRHKTMGCLRNGLKRGAMCVPLRHVERDPRRAVARQRLFLCSSYFEVWTSCPKPRRIR